MREIPSGRVLGRRIQPGIFHKGLAAAFVPSGVASGIAAAATLWYLFQLRNSRLPT